MFDSISPRVQQHWSRVVLVVKVVFKINILSLSSILLIFLTLILANKHYLLLLLQKFATATEIYFHLLHTHFEKYLKLLKSFI
jgi:hypothetical protein